MATKIINVLKDDRFQDILDIFKKASAQEVIFVLPKKHKALASEEDFEILSATAEEQGKNILILTSNPTINNLALEYSFGVLASEKQEKPPKKSKEKVPETDSEPVLPVQAKEPQKAEVVRKDDENVDEESDETDDNSKDEESADDNDDRDRWNDDGRVSAYYREEEQLPEVELTASKKPTRMLSDIIEPSKESERIKIGISKKIERPLEVNVKREVPKIDINEIESVWQRPSQPVKQSKPANRLESVPTHGQIKLEKMHFSFSNLSRKTLTFLGAGVVVLFAVILYISTGSAHILVKLNAYPLDFNLKIETSGKFLETDPELKRIPGQLFSVQKNIEETFSATGEKDVVQKSRGKIVVYNEYGTASQVLIATTRFESEDGLIFRALQTITVPGTKVENGKIIPGSIQVDIIADKAGDTYNVSPGKFTIPAFKEKGDTNRYQKFYGKSEEAMRGGIIGKAKVVTEQDYIDAKKKIEEKAAAETEQEIKSQASGLKILSLPQSQVMNIVSTAQIDEAADNFTLSTKVDLETVGFKESDLYSLITDYVGKINSLTILPEKIQLEFKDIKFNNEKKSLEFTVFIKGPAYKNIDKETIISDLIGKNEQQIKDYIKRIEGILSAKVTLSPFWVRKVPASKEKIEYEVEYE